MSFNGILSVIVALAMLFSGAYNAEQPEAISARTLTLSDLVVVYENEPIELSPSVSLGVMTQENGAVLDFHMDYGDEQLFPVQIAIDDEKASLALVKGGKSFSISNETLMNILKEQGVDVNAILNFDFETALNKLYQDLLANMDEDEKALFNQLILDLLPTTIDMYTYLLDPANQAQYQADIEKVKQEIRALGGEPDEDVIVYDGVAYDVKIYQYNLNFEQMTDMVDKVYKANVKTAEFYKSYLKLINLIIDQQNKAIEETNARLMEEYQAQVAEAAAAAARAAAAPESAAPAEAGNSLAGTKSILNVIRPVSAVVSTAAPAPAPTALPEVSILEPEPIPTIAPIESYGDIFKLVDAEGLDMAMDVIEYISDDGQLNATDILVEMAMPGMDEPIAYEIYTEQVGEQIVMTMETSIDQDGEYVDLGASVYQDAGEMSFVVSMSTGELEEGEEIDEATGEPVENKEELMSFSINISNQAKPETAENDYKVQVILREEEQYAVFDLQGASDAAGNSRNNVLAGVADGDLESYVEFNLGVSAEPFENVVPTMEETEITSGMIDVLTGKTKIEAPAIAADAASIGGADGPTSIYTAESTPEPTLAPEVQAVQDLQEAVQAAGKSFTSDLSVLADDEAVGDLMSLLMFGYIPEDESEEKADYVPAEETEAVIDEAPAADEEPVEETVAEGPAKEAAAEVPAEETDGEFNLREPLNK